MKLLVIGSAGFIGGAYCKEISKNKNYEINKYDLPDRNILNEGQLEFQIKNSDMVISFAAMANIVECQSNWDRTFDVNIRGTYNIAKFCAIHKKPFIFISTCCVYGNSHDEIEKEDGTEPMAAEPYACSKVADEYIIRGMPGLNYMILRIGTVYGPGQREALFTDICLKNIINDDIIYIDGDGLQTRQLIYIDDLVDGIMKATGYMYNNSGYKQIINLCGNQKISAIDTMRAAGHIIGKTGNYVHREQRYGQTFKENISTEKAYNILKWKPQTDFIDGMKKTYQATYEKHTDRAS